jgi:hypothetical protein
MHHVSTAPQASMDIYYVFPAPLAITYVNAHLSSDTDPDLFPIHCTRPLFWGPELAQIFPPPSHNQTDLLNAQPF